ncbi:MAG: hypothetical protein E7651_05270 [Ruminococcaceae bacterium]|nr:hypothetical protein [Oscillospiraceae bacterium]
MGSRGAFVDVGKGVFDFVQGGQHYMSLGTLSGNPNVKVIIQDSNAVKAPEYSHTAGRIYAVVKNGELKHLAYYDDAHKQAVSIDLAHDHKGVQPHRHVYLSHNKNDPGIPPTAEESALIKKIKKEFHLR